MCDDDISPFITKNTFSYENNLYTILSLVYNNHFEEGIIAEGFAIDRSQKQTLIFWGIKRSDNYFIQSTLK